ncbi:MAG: PqqD family protein [Cyanobacteria bacterium J06560_5]
MSFQDVDGQITNFEVVDSRNANAILDETLVNTSTNQVFSDLGTESTILNFQTGIYHGLDAVGMRIWELVQLPTAVSEIRRSILLEYDVDEETCDRDLKELLESLMAAGLIEVSHGRPA